MFWKHTPKHTPFIFCIYKNSAVNGVENPLAYQALFQVPSTLSSGEKTDFEELAKAPRPLSGGDRMSSPACSILETNSLGAAR